MHMSFPNVVFAPMPATFQPKPRDAELWATAKRLRSQPHAALERWILALPVGDLLAVHRLVALEHRHGTTAVNDALAADPERIPA